MNSAPRSSTKSRGDASSSASGSANTGSNVLRVRRSTNKPRQVEDPEDEVLELQSDIEEDDDDIAARGAEFGSGLVRARFDFSGLRLKPDADNRPLWAVSRQETVEELEKHSKRGTKYCGYVFLETFSPISKQASDFLIAIADPMSRPQYIHEFKITEYSLYAATSLGLRTEDILSTLERFSKIELSEELRRFIVDATIRCGKVNLLLRRNRYFIQSAFKDTLKDLLQDRTIKEALIDPATSVQITQQEIQLEALNSMVVRAPRAPSEAVDPESGLLMVTATMSGPIILPGTNQRQANQRVAMGLEPEPEPAPNAPARASGAAAGVADMDVDVEDDTWRDVDHHVGVSAVGPGGVGEVPTITGPKRKTVYAFEVEGKSIETVRKACNDMRYPMLEEYEFRKDNRTPDLPITLKASTSIRGYQEKSLSKMFGNGRARSGIIVLPCGAGKTLVGITAMATIKKSCLIFCTTGVAVYQWRKQIKQWAHLEDKHICMFTSQHKDEIRTDSFVLITTYNMVAYNQKRSDKAEKIINKVKNHEWGLVVLDEVQVAPAHMFRKCMTLTHSMCKLGLTATLVREDNLIEDLFFLIGPKLYEANWQDLQSAGHIATVQCIEVWCHMTSEFYSEHMRAADPRRQQLLYNINPQKFRICQFLINYHERRGDKVLVFSDDIEALKLYALTMKKPFIYGPTSDSERNQVLELFQSSSGTNCLFISKVGDNSIDLPDVNVIIQISSHYASRRQEAQRLGRILRPKNRTSSAFNAFFYTLVCKDTKEAFYAAKRQRFLVDQGYAFTVVPEFPEVSDPNHPDLLFGPKEQQLELLAKVLAIDSVEEEHFDDEGQFVNTTKKTAGRTMTASTASRKSGSVAALTGGDDLVYTEVKASETSRGSLASSSATANLTVPQRGGTTAAAASGKSKPRHPVFEARSKKKK